MTQIARVLPAVCLISCAPVLASGADTEYDWPYYAHDPGSSKYAELDQIDRETVRALSVAWTWDSPDNAHVTLDDEHIPGPFKSTPIKIGGSLYVSTPMGFVAAIDAASGDTQWIFDTKTYEDGRPANIGFNHRGVAYWEKGGRKRIIIGTNNAYLWSLDAETGRPDTSFGDRGRADLTKGWGREIERRHHSVVAAPVIVGDTVVFGGVVTDYALWGLPPGHIRGYDLDTGAMQWIFHSIPEPGEKWNETWEDGSWKTGGATNVWSLISADLELGYVYLPFGSPSNDWYGGERPGDNVYGNSLVCLDARTGRVAWHFQTVHHDLWDYDLPAAPTLVDITVGGRDIKAVAQVSKQGFLYVFDRVTGDPVWPIEELPVAQSKVPGERTAATQPFPSWPKPFDLQGMSPDDLIDFTPELRAEALAMLAKYEFGGLFTPPSLEGTVYMPGWGGGAEWSGAAYDPVTDLYYIPSITMPIVVQVKEQDAESEFRYRGRVRRLRGPKGLPITRPPYSRVSAIDLNTGVYRWVVPNGDGIRQRIIDLGIPDPGPVGAMGMFPPLLTRTLLFLGVNDGGPKLRAFDKSTGAIVHQTPLPLPPAGAPMTYMVAGKQYIAVASGGAKDAKLVALALP